MLCTAWERCVAGQMVRVEGLSLCHTLCQEGACCALPVSLCACVVKGQQGSGFAAAQEAKKRGSMPSCTAYAVHAIAVHCSRNSAKYAAR